MVFEITCSYVGFATVPPVYPLMASITPSSASKAASMHQKHPPAKVETSYFERSIFSFSGDVVSVGLYMNRSVMAAISARMVMVLLMVGKTVGERRVLYRGKGSGRCFIIVDLFSYWFLCRLKVNLRSSG